VKERGKGKEEKGATRKGLDDESDVTLGSSKDEESGARKLSLSPTQYLANFATGALGGSKPARQRSMERPSALSSPVQALGAKRKETSVDVPVEAVACMVESGVDTVQLGNQGHSLGSSSASPPLPSFNMPPTEHAQALHRNLAAELIHAGSGRSPLLPSKIRCPQEPGTAVSINAPFVARRNNLNSSLQEGNLSASSPVVARALSAQEQSVEERDNRIGIIVSSRDDGGIFAVGNRFGGT
jgi:hypothetical protein